MLLGINKDFAEIGYIQGASANAPIFSGAERPFLMYTRPHCAKVREHRFRDHRRLNDGK